MRRAFVLAVALVLTVGAIVAHGSKTTVAEQEHLPDGRIAFVRGGDLWVWEAGKERQVTRTGKVSSPRFSHTGRYIAYLQDQALWIIDLKGGGSWQVEESGAVVPPPAWSPTDEILAFTRVKHGVQTVFITEQGPGTPVQVAQGWYSFAWSPNGKELAVVRQEPGEKRFTGTVAIATVPRSGGRPHLIFEERYPRETARGPVGPITLVKWSADGEWLAFYRQGLFASEAMDCNELAVAPIKGGTPLSVGMGPANPDWFSWAPTGAVLAFTDGVGRSAFERKVVRVATMPPSAPFRSFTPVGYADRDPAWSQDGRQLALTRSLAKWPGNMNRPAPEQAIWAVNVVTGSSRRVLGSEDGITPRWGSNESILWARRQQVGSDLWYQPRPDSQPLPLVRRIDLSDSYYGQWWLSRVFDWWSSQAQAVGKIPRPAGADSQPF